jgi:chemotaxis protein CheC
MKNNPDLQNEGITLSPADHDALRELINIWFGRAASALSTLVSQRVLLDAPTVKIYPVQKLNSALSVLSGQDVINVHQVFRGKLSGDAMLLMETHSASILADMLAGGSGKPSQLTANDREALVETGNIVLNAFIGSFGNLLRVHITFTVPHLKVETLGDLLHALATNDQGIDFALVVKIQFRLTQGDVVGYVLIVMGIQSMETLLQAMKEEGFSY